MKWLLVRLLWAFISCFTSPTVLEKQDLTSLAAFKRVPLALSHPPNAPLTGRTQRCLPGASRVLRAVAVQSLHGHTDQLQPAPSPEARCAGSELTFTSRRSSQKPPAALYEDFKSRFSGVVQNVSAAEIPDAGAGVTAPSDDAPAVLPR